jgi:uncharacterized protein with von Willebrand factor type A (vWA) domain
MAAQDDEHVIRQDSYDIASFDAAREGLPDLAAVQANMEKRDPAARALLEDIYASLYKLAPSVDPGGATPALHEVIINEMLQTTEHDKLRAVTQLNEAASALGTIELAQRLLTKMPTSPKAYAPSTVQMPDEINLIGAKNRDAMRRAIRAMVREANEATEEVMEDMASLGQHGGGGFGSGGGGAPSITDVAEVAAARQRIARAPLLRDIMTLAGRMRRLALRKHADRVRHGPDELVDVELGDDLSRTMPSELAMLHAHPALRMDFLLRLAERRVLQYRMEGREKHGKGPVVVCIDTSASMKGQREVWSKAMALGLLAIALQERRDFAVVLYSDQGQVKVFEYEVRPKLETVLNSLQFFFGNGTDFETPLDKALEICQRNPKMDTSDILFITDGECAVSPAWGESFTKKREAKGTRLYSIVIGTQSQSMTWLSDGIVHIHNLNQDDEATDLAFGSI